MTATPITTEPMRTVPTSSARTRRGFALTGPSIVLDPAVFAVRSDLADIRLAGQVFASHYARCVPCHVTRAVGLRIGREESEPVTMLTAGDRFEMLEVSGDLVWGRAVEAGLVGYLDRDAVEADA